MITAFACGETERIFRGERSRKLPPDIQNTARRKLEYLHRVRTLRDLLAPPGNRLEALKGNRSGQQHPHQSTVADLLRLAGRQCRASGNRGLSLNML